MLSNVTRKVAGQEVALDNGRAALQEERKADQRSFYERHGKRIFDVVLTLLLVIPSSPLILLIWIVQIFQKGPVIFGHKRVGSAGREFFCLKFRTMLPDAESRLQKLLAQDSRVRSEWERNQKLENDPRITKVGRFLRKSSLDELPQFWNVLRGDMSLVGPRPVTATELERYDSAARTYLALKPGVTGLWQVSGRNDVSYERRVALDQEYAARIGFWRDLSIVARTALVVFGANGK